MTLLLKQKILERDFWEVFRFILHFQSLGTTVRTPPPTHSLFEGGDWQGGWVEIFKKGVKEWKRGDALKRWDWKMGKGLRWVQIQSPTKEKHVKNMTGGLPARFSGSCGQFAFDMWKCNKINMEGMECMENGMESMLTFVCLFQVRPIKILILCNWN